MSEYTQVGLVGLGPMGQALARALVGAGVTTQAWNRSPGRTEAGIMEATTVRRLASTSGVVVVCLRDHTAFRAALADVPAGTSVVNMSSSTPDVARASAEWARSRGLRYLSVAIMVPPGMVGTDEALFFASGARAEFDALIPILAPLGGFEYLGDDAGAASLMDMAMLDVFFSGMTAFLHAAAMLTANGRGAGELVPWAATVLDVLGDALEGLARDVDSGAFPGDADRLSMNLAAIDHVVATGEEAGLDGTVIGAVRNLVAAEVEAGGGDQGFSRVVQSLRRAR